MRHTGKNPGPATPAVPPYRRHNPYGFPPYFRRQPVQPTGATSLPDKDKPIIIRFQPWIISEREQLIKAFLDQLRKTLGKPGLSEHANEASKKLEVFEHLLGYAAWLPTVGGYAEKAKNFIKMLSGTAQSISKQFEEDLEANKESICIALSKLPSPLVVIVDDVDRLSHQEIRQLFQLIKAVADFPKAIYLLAFDHVLVEKALEPFQSGSETRYLEKIVQLDFEVPSPSRGQIAAVLWNGLSEIEKTIPSDGYEQNRWKEIRFGPLGSLCRNIRDVKRYLNAVNFMFPVIKGEVSAVDLLIVEAIHIFAPSLYKVIKNNKELLTSDSPLAMSRSIDKKDKNDWMNGLPELAPEHFRKEIKEMLIYLFPEAELSLKNRGYGDGFFETWEKNQRICISSYFDHYFQGTLPEGAVSAKETERVIEVLESQYDLTLRLNDYLSDGRITKLLPKIEYYFKDNINETKIQNLLTAIFESGESLPLKPTGFFDISPDWIIGGTIYRLLKLLDKGARKKVFLNALRSSKNAIVFPMNEISYIWKEWNPTEEGKESPKSEEEKLLSKEETEELKNEALVLIKKYKDSDVLYKSRHLLSTLYYWEKWSNLEEVKSWVAIVLADEKKIPEFLGGCGGFTASAGMSSHYETYKFQINIDSLKRYCDIDQLKKKCADLLRIPPDLLTDNYKEILRIFIDGLEGKER